MNSWLARRAEQDVPCVSAQKAEIERGRAARERERSREIAAGRTSAIVSVRKLSIQKTGKAVSSPFLPLAALWE